MNPALLELMRALPKAPSPSCVLYVGTVDPAPALEAELREPPREEPPRDRAAEPLRRDAMALRRAHRGASVRTRMNNIE